MTKLLLRLFVKNYRDCSDPAVRSAIGRLAGTAGIVCNIVLFTIKLAAGLLSGAVSIIADAVNNLSDAASSIVTLLGFRLAQRPADEDHPYGHARYEYLSGLIVAALILVISVELAESSVRKIFQPVPVEYSLLTFGVLVCSVVIKLWMCAFNGKLGKMIHSTALKAVCIDSRNDVIATGAVLAGCAVHRLWGINLDGWLGLGVAVFIGYSGVAIARETISPLLGQRADRELAEKISQLILSREKVLGIHDLLVHDYGPGKCFASVHVELSAQEDPMDCHDIIDAIECNVLQTMNVHLVIHYDPVVVDDDEWIQMRSVMEDIIAQIDPNLSMHDFRLVRDDVTTRLVFDLAVPYSMRQEHGQLKEQIDAQLRHRNKAYETVIRFDDKE